MFSAALISAWLVWLHERHRNSDWPGRLLFSEWPQREQDWLVFLGSTVTTDTPAISALYSTNKRNCENAQECRTARCLRPALTRARMCLRSSSAMPRSERLASTTICLEMLWFTQVAKRRSFPERDWRRRFAARVCFF